MQDIGLLHEFYRHPKLLHGFDNLIHVGLIQNFLDRGKSHSLKMLVSYKPLVEGAALADIYVNKPNLFVTAFQCSDSNTRNIAEKLISIHEILVQLGKRSITSPLIRRLGLTDQPIKPLHGISTSIMLQLASLADSLLIPHQLAKSFNDPGPFKSPYQHYSIALDYLRNCLWTIQSGKPLSEEQYPKIFYSGLYRFWSTLQATMLIQNQKKNAIIALRAMLSNWANVCKEVIIYLVRERKVKFPITRRKPLFTNIYRSKELERSREEGISMTSRKPTDYWSLFNFMKANVLNELERAAERHPESDTSLYEITTRTFVKLLSDILRMYKRWEKGEITNPLEVIFYKNNFDLHYHLEDSKSFWHQCSLKVAEFFEAFDPIVFEQNLREVFNSFRKEKVDFKVARDFKCSWAELGQLGVKAKEKITELTAFDLDRLVENLRKDGISIDSETVRRAYKTGEVLFLS